MDSLERKSVFDFVVKLLVLYSLHSTAVRVSAGCSEFLRCKRLSAAVVLEELRGTHGLLGFEGRRVACSTLTASSKQQQQFDQDRHRGRISKSNVLLFGTPRSRVFNAPHAVRPGHSWNDTKLRTCSPLTLASGRRPVLSWCCRCFQRKLCPSVV